VTDATLVASLALLGQELLNVSQLALGLTNLNLIVFKISDASRVITPILKPFESFKKNIYR
jgi:hypothetical protein